MEYYLGIDVGATSFKVGVIDDKNEIVYQNSIPTSYKQTNDEALNNLSMLIDDAASKYKIESVGVGLPGVVKNGKIKMSPNLPYWKNIDFGTYLRNKYIFPIAVDNDANAAAFAELIVGNGKELDNFVYITLGTGVGGAIVINKNIYRGNKGGAGEIGHIIFDPIKTNIKNKYRNGALETMLGKQGIIDSYNELNKNDNANKIDKIDVKHIADNANKGDKIATQTISIAGVQLGIAIATINHILDIGNFIIGGGISQSELLIKTAKFVAREHSLPTVSKVTILRAKYSQNTGIIGAALLGKTQGKIHITTTKRTSSSVFGRNFTRTGKRKL